MVPAMDADSGLAAPARPVVTSLYRLQWEPAQNAYVLLFPEGMVKLNASAGEILRRCDGCRTGRDIVAELEVTYPGTPLAADVLAFLEIAANRGWIAGLRA